MVVTADGLIKVREDTTRHASDALKEHNIHKLADIVDSESMVQGNFHKLI
jgi:hypothetical protein